MVNYMDPRSTVGRLSRGNNIYRGTSNAAGNWPSGGWGGRGAQPAPYTPPAPPSTTPGSSPGSLPRQEPGTYQWPTSGWGGSAGAGGGGGSWPSLANPAPSTGGGGGGTQQTYEQFMQQVLASLPGLGNFDALYEDLMRIFQEQAGVLDLSQGRETDRINNQFAVILERLQQNLGKSLEQNEYNMADRGILRSGINVREQGRINEGFSQQDADLRGEQAGALESLISQITNERNKLVQEAQRAEIEKAYRAQEAQQNQAMIAAQAAAHMYGQQMQAQQPTPSPTGQYQPGQPAPTSPTTPPPRPALPTLQSPIAPTGPKPGGTLGPPSQGMPGGWGGQTPGGFRPQPTPGGPTRPSTQARSSAPTPQQPASGAIERRLRRF